MTKLRPARATSTLAGFVHAVRRLLSWLLPVLFASAATHAAAQLPPAEHHIAVSLVAESMSPAPGGRTTLAIVMKPQPGWHGYWRNPGDAGLPPKLTWSLPGGVNAGDPAYPTPKVLLITGIMNHVYDQPYALLVPLTLKPGIALGTKLPVKLAMSYLVCTEQECVPEQAEVATDLTAGGGAIDQGSVTRFGAWRDALPRDAQGPSTYAIAGGKFRLVMPLPPGVRPTSPHLFVDASKIVDFAAAQTISKVGNWLVFETKPVAASIDGPISVVAGLGDGRGIQALAKPGSVPANGTPIVATSTPPRSSPPSEPGRNVVTLTFFSFLGAMLGGLILNVMPCVFPILSLKALSLARSSSDAGSARREALAYSAGVIAVCVALGSLILALRAAGDQVGWAFQLQKPGVIFGLVLLVTAIGFNLSGLFELGSINAGSDLAAKEGPVGAFWTGALAAFVATPCTGPFMAAALGIALVLPTAAALLIFAGLGVGLALPFLAIGFIPALRRALPKPGAWMSTFRHVLAVPMFVTALGLAWVLGNQTGSLGVIVTLAAMLVMSVGLWATGLRQRAIKERAWIPSAVAAAFAIAFLTFLPSFSEADARLVRRTGTETFDPARLASLRAEGRPVFLYLTADWCLSCKVNEKTAIERTETQEAFAKAGVVTMVGDWTRGDSKITHFLDEQKRSGVPVYLWYAPGAEPRVLPQILTPSLLAGLAAEHSSNPAQTSSAT